MELTEKRILIYLPAYNEEKTIEQVLNGVLLFFDSFKKVEILVINDGSTDNTGELASKAGATVITHTRNRGVGKVFHTAIEYALKIRADILVSIDADGQFDVSQISKMIRPIIDKQADFSIGNRFAGQQPEKMPKIKFWGNKQISRIVSLICKTKIHDASCGFRAYSKNCLLSLNLQGNFTYTHESILELIHKGFHVAQIPVTVYYFDDRVSKMANNLIRYALKISIIIFQSMKDYKPLQFFLGIAGIVFLLAFILGGFVTVYWINTGMITPYKSLGFIALALCGMAVVISTLAFIADMLNRIRDNQEKLLYLTKKKYFDQD